MRLVKFIIIFSILTSISYSQSFYAGLNGGVKYLVGESYYSNPIGVAGSYLINGTRALSA